MMDFHCNDRSVRSDKWITTAPIISLSYIVQKNENCELSPEGKSSPYFLAHITRRFFIIALSFPALWDASEQYIKLGISLARGLYHQRMSAAEALN